MTGRKQWQQGVRVARWRLCRLALLPCIPCDPGFDSHPSYWHQGQKYFPSSPKLNKQHPSPESREETHVLSLVPCHSPQNLYCFSHLKLLAHRRLSKCQVDEPSKFTFILKKTLPWPVCPLLIVLYLF